MSEQQRRDDAYWAKPVTRLEPTEADASNVRGRRLNAAAGGFGWLYQKTFRVRLTGASVTPREVVAAWKAHFGDFWAKGREMFLPATGIAPGEIGIISDAATVPVAPALHTGVLVIYADDESFSFMSPEGHPFAGPLTFSSYADEEDGVTVVQVQELTRASDPFWELMMHTPILGERMQNEIWRSTLRNIATHFGVDAPVETRIVVVDRRWQWKYARNIWQNAGIRSTLTAPVRWLRPRGRTTV
jgi:hypothetical protein